MVKPWPFTVYKMRSIMVTFVFPGQGSQKKGMGEELFGSYPDLIKLADEVLGYSIVELCLEDTDNNLNFTQYTQPALFVVNALSFHKYLDDGGKGPDFLAGHSLGEYDALYGAGAFDFETGVRIVQKRGELMGKASGGGMAAVIGLEENEIKEVIKQNNLTGIAVANYNSPGQIVISGPNDEMVKAEDAFEDSEAQMFIPLKVSGAFHTQYMNDAKEEFVKFLEECTFSKLKNPVIANVNAEPYKNDEIKNNLANQITSSVRWTDTINYLLDQGEMEFIEIGPGNVLAGLIKRIKRSR